MRVSECFNEQWVKKPTHNMVKNAMHSVLIAFKRVICLFFLSQEMKAKVSFIQMMPLLLWAFFASRKCMWRIKYLIRYRKVKS